MGAKEISPNKFLWTFDVKKKEFMLFSQETKKLLKLGTDIEISISFIFQAK